MAWWELIFIHCVFFFLCIASFCFEENEKRSESCMNANRKRNESTALKFNYGNWIAAPRSEAYRRRSMVACVCVCAVSSNIHWMYVFLYRPISIFAMVIRLRAVTVGGFYTTRKFLCGEHFRKRANKKAWKNENEGTTIPRMLCAIALSRSIAVSRRVPAHILVHFSAGCCSTSNDIVFTVQLI